VSFPVFFDTCTLYGALITDVILRLAEKGAFRPLWSPHVFDELETNLAERFDPDLVRRRLAAMNGAFPDAKVTGYESLIDQMTCHPKDRHVLAAAVRANADLLVTFNLKDFPRAATEAYDLEAIHPDEFLQDQFDLFPQLVLTALDDLADAYEQPPMSLDELLDALRVQVPDFATAVAESIW
jgi:predicted nucleic acid-binding protein